MFYFEQTHTFSLSTQSYCIHYDQLRVASSVIDIGQRPYQLFDLCSDKLYKYIIKYCLYLHCITTVTTVVKLLILLIFVLQSIIIHALICVARDNYSSSFTYFLRVLGPVVLLILFCLSYQ